MPTARRPRRRTPRRRISPEAIAAFQAADYSALHLALSLPPWARSPLPREITSFGVSDDDDLRDDQAIKLQRELLAAVGWPDCRDAYQQRLADAEKTVAYYTELVRHPDRGGIGTNSDPASRRRALQEAEADVAYRRQLLEDLDEGKA